MVTRKREQRIKMRISHHPVKLDGTITDFAPDGSHFTVRFDGPVATTRFYPHGTSGQFVVNRPIGAGGKPAPDAEFWEVL